MKNSLLKKAGALLCAALLAGTVQLPIFAADPSYNSDFANQTDTMDLLNTGNFDSTYAKSYRAGLGGRASSDYALVADMNNVAYGSEPQGGFLVPYNLNQVLKDIDGKTQTLEMSMLYGGDTDYMQLQAYVATNPSTWSWLGVKVFVKVQDGVVYVLDQDTGIRCQKDEWLRVVIEEHYNAEQTKIYVNGQEIEHSLNGYILGNRNWVQANGCFTKASTGEGTRSGYIAVDDVKIYSSAYAPTGEETVSYTLTNEFNSFNKDKETVYVPDGTTLDTVLAAVTTAAERAVYSAHSNGTVISDTSAAAQDGNVVVFKSADGRSYDYLTIKIGKPPVEVIAYEPMSESTSFNSATGNAQFDVSKPAGLYGKAATDYAYKLTLKDDCKPATTDVSDRFAYMPAVVNNNLHANGKVFTTEFSVAGEGNFDSLQPIAFFTTTKLSDGQAGDDVFCTPVTMNKKDGVVVNGKKIMDFKDKQWYRVAVTWYPEDFAVDVYINGVEAAKNYVFAPGAVDTLKISNFYGGAWANRLCWFALQQVYNKNEAAGAPEHNGSFAFDDTYIYYGEYDSNAKNAASLTSEAYKVDEASGSIYISGTVEAGDFADAVTAVGDMTVYTDSTCTEEAEELTSGAVVVVKSENGFVYKYYTVLSPDTRVDNIQYFVNGESSNIIEDNCTIKATVSAYAPAYAKLYGTLMLAVYENGVLTSVVTDPKAIDGETDFEASQEIKAAKGVTAKAMFWKTLTGAEPWTTAQTFVTLD